MFGLRLGRLGGVGASSQIQRAISLLRRFGTDAHLWLPGGDVKTYGPELVVNGGFDSADGWTVGVGWSIAGGVASATASSANTYKNIGAITGRSYQVVFTVVSASAGVVAVAVGGAVISTWRSAAGTYTTDFIAAGNSNVEVKCSGFTGSIDNISVREITSQTSVIQNGLTTGNYLESTGNTLLTVDNPAGLVLDALGSVGSELVTNVGGPFTATTGYVSGTANTATLAVVSGQIQVTSTSAWGRSATQLTCVIGRTYQVVASGLGANTRLAVGTTSDNEVTSAATASASFHFVATATTHYLSQIAYSATIGTVATFSGISVREVSGIHLTQATTANKPILRRGLTNLLTWSNDLTNAAWQKTDLSAVAWTIGANVADPFGGTNAVTMVISGSRIFRAPSVPSVSGAIYTQYLWVRSSATGGASNIRLTTNNTSAWNTGSSEKIALSQSWTLVARSGVAQTGASTAHVMFGCLDAAGSVDATCLGNIDVYAAGFTLGTLTAQQIIDAGGIPTTTTAAASNPSAGRYSWGFDGSNDSLLSGNLGITNACTIVIAGRLDSFGVNNVLFGEDSNGAYFFVQSSGTVLLWKNGIGPMATSSAGEIVSGVPFVLTCRLDGGTVVIRKNGVQIVSSATGQTFTATTGAKIGTNFAGVNPIAGAIGNVLALPVALTDAECLLVERMAAANFPNGPVF